MQGVELRPLGVGEILDVGIKITWRHAWTLIRTVLIIVAPVQVLAAVIQLSAMPDSYIEIAYGTRTAEEVSPFEPIDESEVWASIAAFGIAALLGAVATTLATGACYKAVADAYLGERPTWRTSLGYALRRLHSLLWVTVIYSIGVGIGFLLCILPGIYLAVAWVVAIPALLTERRKGFGAIGRSYSLVQGRWWPSFALMLVGVLIAGFISYAVQFLAFAPAFTGGADDPVLLLAANAVGSTLSAALWTPLIAAFATVLYFDLRVRKEGFDLALLAERIGVAPDPARVPLAPRVEVGPAGQPPYWPPPVGWQPPGQPPAPGAPPAAGAGEPPSEQPPSEQPPYWPPPPGWKPGGRQDE
jgi:hypothetical protein